MTIRHRWKDAVIDAVARWYMPVAVLASLVVVGIAVWQQARGGVQADPDALVVKPARTLTPDEIRALSAHAGTLPASGPVAGTCPKTAMDPMLADLADMRSESLRGTVLWVHAGFCPYCAAESWPLALALMRYGALSGISGLRSGDGAGEPYPDTAGLDLDHAVWRGPLRLRSITVADRRHNPVAFPTDVADILSIYDIPPFTPTPGSIPLLIVGGRYLRSGSAVDPGLYRGAQWGWSGIIAELGKPGSALGKAVDAEATAIAGAVCRASRE